MAYENIVQKYIDEQTAGIIHEFPPGWQPGDWLVPTVAGRACIKHGHTDPSDHANCGPTLWCCLKSLRRFCALFPDSEEARADWQLITGPEVEKWMDAGVLTVWFGFCDPNHPAVVRFIGTQAETARETIRGEIQLSEYLDEAHIFGEQVAVAPDQTPS